ncbi:MAG: hypothetical protein M1814_006782 [Vezdaea aestivalis]|nr:MAG: hypothetical protein M1814_006782 [Vezdaea aestivalis]
MAEPQWPPRSPHEALISSPSGRRKLRTLHSRTSPSPSPVRKAISTPSFHERTRRLAEPESPLKGHRSDDEENEETLKLQLEAIEKKLKLKRLQQAKVKEQTRPPAEGHVRKVAEDVQRETTQSRLEARKQSRKAETSIQPDVQIPLSPPPRPISESVQRSPRRVLMGIDKGLRAQDVSLRRPSYLKSGSAAPSSQSSRAESRAGPTFHRASSKADSVVSGGPKSYSERIAELRDVEASKEEKQQRLRQTRSKNFEVNQAEISGFKRDTVTFKDVPDRKPREFTRKEVLRSANSDGRGAPASNPSRGNDANQRPGSSTSQDFRSSQASASSIFSANPRSRPTSSSGPEGSSTPSDFESFSSCHLSKRVLPHAFLNRQLTGKKVYLLPDLLREVKSPDYEPPDVEGDWILFGIIASKSDPKNHQNDQINNKDRNRTKFMAITLTDLKWELTLFLFGSAFEKWWKLPDGTLIALLNPPIMPPPQHQTDTGRFSLTLHSADETLLEIGTARDLGWCESKKKDGKLCSQWVDLRHTRFCEFHINIQVQKTKAGRMEVNTMTGGSHAQDTRSSGGRGGARGGKSNFSSGGRGGQSRSADGSRHDRSSGTNYWVSARVPGHGRSTANLIDDDETFGSGGVNKQERFRKQLAEHEKERDIARRLGEMGNGIGGEYLRYRDEEASNRAGSKGPSKAKGETPADAGSLGLIGTVADSIRLSPIKRKRGLGGPMAEPMGWGGAYKKGIPLEKKGEDEERVKKKTRFVTSKGIREAGRESLGNNDLPLAGIGDSDDDLVVI